MLIINKRKEGKFVGSFASYGYLKDPQDKNKLIVDEEVAPIIRDIYDWFIEGYGVISIAKKLKGKNKHIKNKNLQ